MLPAHEWLAVELRYNGHTYANISKKIKQEYDLDFCDGTIKNWFCRNGKLYELFEEYAKKHNELEMELYKHYLRGNIAKATKVLINLINSNDPAIQLRACQEIISRIEGKSHTKDKEDTEAEDHKKLKKIQVQFKKYGADDKPKRIV